MTEKDYIKLAKVIKDNTLTDKYGTTFISAMLSFVLPDSLAPSLGRLTVGEFLDDLCALLKEDNPNFDKERFITACK